MIVSGDERVDPEWLAFAAGLKPAIRIAAPPARAPELAARFRRMGAAVDATEAMLDGERQAILYLARTPSAVAALRDLEAPLLDRAANAESIHAAHRALGRALGFPACCTESFARLARPEAESDGAEAFRLARAAACSRPDPLLDDLLFAARLRVIGFHPCRYDCPAASALARATLALIATHDRPAATHLARALRQPVAVDRRGRRAILAFAADRLVAAEPPRTPSGAPIGADDQSFATELLAGTPTDALVLRFDL